MSRLLTILLLLQAVITFAQPVNNDKHLAMAGGSLSKILSTAVSDMFHAPVKHDKRDAKWIVQAGDTGNGIAARLGIEFDQLASLNPTVQWTNLQIGQVLRIPCDDSNLPAPVGGTQYTVVAGDTGNAIAAAAGITFAALDSANPGVNWYNLQIGQVLNLPTSSTSISTTTSMTSTTSTMTDSTTSTTSTASSTSISSTTSMDSTTLTISIDSATSTTPMDSVPSTSTMSISSTTSATSTMSMVTTDPTTSTTSTISLDSTTSMASTASTVLTTSTTSTTGFPTQDSAPPSSSVSQDSATDNGTDDSDSDTDEPPPAQPYPTDSGPGTNPFLSPESKRDLPLVKIRLVRNNQSQSIYTVKAGDTGLAIAAVYGISFDNLSNSNPGVTWTNLQIGQTLKLPVVKQSQTSNSVQNQVGKAGQDVYVMYSGAAANSQYPAMSNWLDFETLWKANLANIGTNCDFSSGQAPANTQAETTALKKAIVSVSAETSVNPSFILATILQESAGCVRAPTTKSWEGISNPGLMQSFKGRASCNTGSRMMQPCTGTTIRDMIMEGVKGNVNVGIMPALKVAASGFGISWPISKSQPRAQGQQGKPVRLLGGGVTKKVDEAMLYYQAARIYNSGGLPANGDLSAATGSTRCYVSDIANRLMGWVNAKRQCSL